MLRGYDVLVTAAALVASPVLVAGLALRRDWRAGLTERLGVLPATPKGRSAVWVHGASVGEIAALGPVVRALRHEYPDYRLVLSSLTPGGRSAATTSVPDADDRVLFPLDVGFAARRAVTAVAPRLVLFSETELWPNFLAVLAARGIPAIMLSGRVSERAFRRYRRARWLFAPALATVRWFCVQSLETARRLVALGAPADRIVVTGSLKAADPLPRATGALSLARLGVLEHPVVVAGSTHEGEEEAVLAAWESVAAAMPGARLILAPRRPERWTDVSALLERRHVRFVRRTDLGSAPAPIWPADTPVLLLDTLGELSGLYAGARVAFVGGTLAPIGGHNLLEPAAQGTPVVFGPHVENARATADHLVAAGAGWEVRDAEQLARRLGSLLADPTAAREAGRCAREAVAERTGPLTVTLAIVRGVLGAGA